MWNCQQLIGMTVAAVDGELGRLSDLCFDEERWVIRYFVVDALASDAKVLIALEEGEEVAAPLARLPEWPALPVRAFGNTTFVDASRAECRAAPWTDALDTRPALGPAPMPPPFLGRLSAPAMAHDSDGRMCRVEEVRGYRVVACDGDVGQVEGFLISESSWAIEYVVIRVREADAVKRVVLVPSWIRSIDRESCRLQVDVTRDLVLSGPEFTEDVHDAYETWLFGNLGRLVAAVAH